MNVAKPIQLQQLGTQMFVTLKGFSDERYTGQVQFHITMNQGGVSRAVLLTQAAFGYDRAIADQMPLDPGMRSPEPPPPPPPPPPEGGPNIQHKAPPINLIATMSKKE
jgi:hypothetical protein